MAGGFDGRGLPGRGRVKDGGLLVSMRSPRPDWTAVVQQVVDVVCSTQCTSACQSTKNRCGFTLGTTTTRPQDGVHTRTRPHFQTPICSQLSMRLFMHIRQTAFMCSKKTIQTALVAKFDTLRFMPLCSALRQGTRGIRKLTAFLIR